MTSISFSLPESLQTVQVLAADFVRLHARLPRLSRLHHGEATRRHCTCQQAVLIDSTRCCDDLGRGSGATRASQKLSASANCESVEAHVAGARPAWHEGPDSANAKLGMRIERPSNAHGHKTQTVYQVNDTKHQPEQARSQSADIPRVVELLAHSLLARCNYTASQLHRIATTLQQRGRHHAPRGEEAERDEATRQRTDGD